ncbi:MULTISPECIES: flagellar basal body L-ring protein FlgH [Thauera]|jgi:flagellar L-ring protein precursor FlgH|uniref:flagellar basal body L-ring protein FlgH n=1 Tax=Thauera TaxID=33057 RepID=UPI0005ADC464|nr:MULTISPECIES: flagellar basal body L-ring protein FlgH [Thauera]MDA0234709.1 flagellar basal body L-ring protein FlgH [Pseudomonadota bacterium]OPZ06350.1 MAG: Flagellar L-ring protein precursor [Alphaproteobacteria bacterium ADurb.BinA305]KIN88320.1 flagellar L-ring family protein [Thauera sp. SWB20]MCK6399043.1 flagellar basal body L-ring protein FlgH [Thauera aminoaromatica]HNV91567.1 flagellar basal body L-ring protein FlgH [Thauera aminoaromatica]
MKLARHSIAVGLLALLSGCAAIQTTPPSAVHQPMSVRPEAMATALPANGAIYQTVQARPLFEDRRARRIGDTITINLVERNTAEKSANANATRNGNMSAGIGPINRLPLSGLNGLELEADAESDFNGKGAAAANNVFNGTITVTVIDVYPNGNLLVSGEKMVAINQGNEFIRFSGVINPNTVTTANTVQSTQVADARIEYRGSGFIDESNTMGWLQRFFVAIMPF